MNHPLIDYISNFVAVDEATAKAIVASIPIEAYAAGTVLLREGSISRVSYFNLKGCVRLYHLVDGVEKTTFFYTENTFISSMRSFTTNSPANHSLECLEDCTLALIPYDTERDLLTRFPALETFARVALEQELANYQDMLSHYIISNPEQRYLKLLHQQPELLQRIPLYHLASYIGVQAETLSRIRKRIAQRPS